MEFFDSHSHYNDEKFDLDREEIAAKYNSDELSQALGMLNCHVVGIVDRGFAKLLKE